MRQLTPRSRPATSLPDGQQGDHVTPYGIIKGATEFYAKRFLEADLRIQELRKTNAIEEDFKDLDDKKQRYRHNLIRILAAVSIFNKDVFQIVQDGEETKEQDGEETKEQEGEETKKQFFSPDSKRRNNHLKNIKNEIEEMISDYQNAREKYERTIVYINGLKDNEVEMHNILREQNEVCLFIAKEHFVESMAKKSLRFFNNIKGITYVSDEGFSAKEMIRKKEYFEYGFIDRNLKYGSGDSMFATDLLNKLTGFAKEFEDNNKKELSSEHVKLITSFQNSFFLPISKTLNDDLKYDESSQASGTRQHSNDELQHHLARHLFLIESCFPFLKEVKFKEGRSNLMSMSELEEHFASKYIKKTQYPNVKEYLKEFSKKLENELSQYNIGATPVRFSANRPEATDDVSADQLESLMQANPSGYEHEEGFSLYSREVEEEENSPEGEDNKEESPSKRPRSGSPSSPNTTTSVDCFNQVDSSVNRKLFNDER